MTLPPPIPLAPRAPLPLSKCAVTSLILGFAGFLIPFLGGLLAVVVGIFGIIQTAKSKRRGTALAIVGIVLGLMTLFGWSVAAGVWGIFKATEGPRVAARLFIWDLSLRDAQSAATQAAPGVDTVALETIHAHTAALGRFKDTTFYQTNIVNDDAEVDGTATFDRGQLHVHARLRWIDGEWKVREITAE